MRTDKSSRYRCLRTKSVSRSCSTRVLPPPSSPHFNVGVYAKIATRRSTTFSQEDPPRPTRMSNYWTTKILYKSAGTRPALRRRHGIWHAYGTAGLAVAGLAAAAAVVCRRARQPQFALVGPSSQCGDPPVRPRRAEQPVRRSTIVLRRSRHPRNCLCGRQALSSAKPDVSICIHIKPSVNCLRPSVASCRPRAYAHKLIRTHKNTRTSHALIIAHM